MISQLDCYLPNNACQRISCNPSDPDVWYYHKYSRLEFGYTAKFIFKQTLSHFLCSVLVIYQIYCVVTSKCLLIENACNQVSTFRK